MAILNIDYPLLAQLAQKAEEEGKTVWRCSSNGPHADVTVVPEDGEVARPDVKHFRPKWTCSSPRRPRWSPGNVACAVAAALSLGVPRRNSGLPPGLTFRALLIAALPGGRPTART